jgi:hypothetical protein
MIDYLESEIRAENILGPLAEVPVGLQVNCF